eukprot:1159568-Pelagomonas_calceolata.AAC.1
MVILAAVYSSTPTVEKEATICWGTTGGQFLIGLIKQAASSKKHTLSDCFCWRDEAQIGTKKCLHHQSCRRGHSASLIPMHYHLIHPMLVSTKSGITSMPHQQEATSSRQTYMCLPSDEYADTNWFKAKQEMWHRKQCPTTYQPPAAGQRKCARHLMGMPAHTG